MSGLVADVPVRTARPRGICQKLRDDRGAAVPLITAADYAARVAAARRLAHIKMTIQTAPHNILHARLQSDDQGVLLLLDGAGVRYQLAVVSQGGWRVVQTTPAERALLDAHGLGSGSVQ